MNNSSPGWVCSYRPGGARGGIITVAVLAGLVGAAMATVLPGAAERGTGAALVGAYLLIVALVCACILIPSLVLGQSRQSFRRRLQSDPVLRKAVEDDLASWRDPYGTAGYRPLYGGGPKG